MNTPRKHAKEMHAYADGAEIEQMDQRPFLPVDGLFRLWQPFNGQWHDYCDYRIKPEPPKYPETRMSDSELSIVWQNPAGALCYSSCYRSVANAALRHAIDSGQVVIAPDITRIAPCGSPMFDAIMAARATRDMAIAKAVELEYQAKLKQYTIIKWGVNLPAIIASVKD